MILSRIFKNHTSLAGFSRNFNFFKRNKDPPKNEIDSVSVEEVKLPIIAEESVKPIIPKRTLEYLSPCVPPRQVWVENLDTVDTNNLGIIDLHPDVFGVSPRVDILFENVHWQKMYKYINWNCAKAKHELGRTSRKPWPQKGTGRSRQGHKRNPHWKGGAKTHGPRGPVTNYYMLDKNSRVLGLCTALSIKLIQEDLHIVKDFNIPKSDADYMLNLIDTRKWGPSVLFVDVCDVMPRNITFATNTIQHMNLIPVFGLNVYSMLKHSTLVLTLDAVDEIEKKLLQNIHGVCRPTPEYDPDAIKVV